MARTTEIKGAEKILQGMDNFIREAAAAYNFSGVIHILVTGPDSISYEKAFGYANLDWKIPNNIGTRFNTASISKVFTACGILKLAEQGRLNLGDALCDHLKFEGTPFSGGITLYHLLTHSSGIADDADEEAGEKYEDIFISKPNYIFRRASDLVENFIGKTPVFEPGQGCRYNNAGYVLLGLVIEKVTGVEYKQWLKKNILAPWGLHSTCFPEMDGINSNTADGYVSVDEGDAVILKKNIYSIPPVGTPEGGIYSTADDLGRLMSGLFGGRFFTDEYTRLISSPQVFHSDYGFIAHWMGFGFEFYIDGDRVVRIQKDGSNPGVSAVMAYYPSTAANIVILSNVDCGVWKMLQMVEEKLGLGK